MNSASHPPDPTPGSHRYFALLYTQAARRGEIAALLAVADEIGTDPAVGADHGVAHVRLAWWRHEAERFARGEPEHPWLRRLLGSTAQSRALNLRPLVDAAEIDLATRTLRRGESEALLRAWFPLAAHALLTCEPGEPLQSALAELGALVQRLERDPGDRTARARLPELLATIGTERQPALTPLLVWLALAASGPRSDSALRTTLSDNFVAWSAARRAARGRFILS